MSGQLVSSLFPPEAQPQPGSPHEDFVRERLAEVGRFGELTLAEHVRRHARERGDRVAYVADGFTLTWAELDALADRLARVLAGAGFASGERVAVLYPDGPTVHAIYLAAERAGLVVVGIGPRAGAMEIRHLARLTGATGLVTAPVHRGQPMSVVAADLRAAGVALRVHVEIEPTAPGTVLVDGEPAAEPPAADLAGRALGLGDIFLLNSTSGTTGMPKCVVHNQNRWLYFHEQVLDAAGLTGDDVLLSLIPAPYGFGIWTAHTTPILLGATAVVMPRFDAGAAIGLIAEARVTSMACVTTQFIMMLNAPQLAGVDLSSLRCMFTGGEAIPYHRAAEFEQRTGAALLNFYGSNETGMLSYTTSGDSRDRRLNTGGKVSPAMRVRLFDEYGAEVAAGPGRSGCRGPAASYGYYADPGANAELFTRDGWMLTGDLCVIDDEGYLSVVGRTSDFIIRGGKNVSAAAAEEQVASHPAVALVAVIGVPDPVFGERVCAVVELKPGRQLDLAGLTEHLAARGVSKETWPERLEIVPRIPRSSGGKIAKGELRDQFGSRVPATEES